MGFKQNVKIVGREIKTVKDSRVLSVRTLSEKTLPAVLNVQAGEKVLFLTDAPKDSELTGKIKMGRLAMISRFKAAFEKMNIPVKGIYVYEETGSNGKSLPESGVLLKGNSEKEMTLKQALGSSQIWIAMNQFSATGPLGIAASKENRGRVVSMPGVDEGMEPAMAVDYSEIVRNAAKLLSVLKGRERLDIIFKVSLVDPLMGETNIHPTAAFKLIVDTRGRHFHADNGVCHEPGKLINFPAGEIYIAPEEGIKEVSSRTRGGIPLYLDPKLHLPTVVLRIKQGKIVLTKTLLRVLPEKVADELSRKEWNKFIAEIAIGLNGGTRTDPSTPTLEYEKSLGFHWAHGSNEHLGGAITMDMADVHQDYVYSVTDSRVAIDMYAFNGFYTPMGMQMIKDSKPVV